VACDDLHFQVEGAFPKNRGALMQKSLGLKTRPVSGDFFMKRCSVAHGSLAWLAGQTKELSLSHRLVYYSTLSIGSGNFFLSSRRSAVEDAVVFSESAASVACDELSRALRKPDGGGLVESGPRV
jgi:hypothetical protein